MASSKRRSCSKKKLPGPRRRRVSCQTANCRVEMMRHRLMVGQQVQEMGNELGQLEVKEQLLEEMQ